MNMQHTPTPEDGIFSEFRKKIRCGEIASSSMESLLRQLKFTGRLCLIVQNGKILKAGYEEGYFSRRQDERLV